MSASHDSSSTSTSTPTAVTSSGTTNTQVPVANRLSDLGSGNANWLAELQKLGYMPNGQSSWGNIGSTASTPASTSLLSSLQS